MVCSFRPPPPPLMHEWAEVHSATCVGMSDGRMGEALPRLSSACTEGRAGGGAERNSFYGVVVEVGCPRHRTHTFLWGSGGSSGSSSNTSLACGRMELPRAIKCQQTDMGRSKRQQRTAAAVRAVDDGLGVCLCSFSFATRSSRDRLPKQMMNLLTRKGMENTLVTTDGASD